MPRRNPSLVGAKLSLSAHRNKFVTFYRGGYLQSGFQLRLRHPTRKPLPARKLTRSNQRASGRAGARATRDRAAEALGKRGRDASDSGSTSCRKRLIPHSTPYSHRLLSRKRRPRRGRLRRPPPTARPQRCGPGAGCEGSPQEAAALQSRRQWRHLGGR